MALQVDSSLPSAVQKVGGLFLRNGRCLLTPENLYSLVSQLVSFRRLSSLRLFRSKASIFSTTCMRFAVELWTGFDIFMGVVMTRIMRLLDLPSRVEVAKRLTPTAFFILPSLAATAITSGNYLAQSENKFNLSSPWIIAAALLC